MLTILALRGKAIFFPFVFIFATFFTSKNGEIYIYPYTFGATIQVQESENCRSYLCYFYYLLLQKGGLMKICFFYSFTALIDVEYLYVIVN